MSFNLPSFEHRTRVAAASNEVTCECGEKFPSVEAMWLHRLADPANH